MPSLRSALAGIVLCLVATAWSQETPPPPADTPAPAPPSVDMARVIEGHVATLGDSDPLIVEESREALYEIGRAAVPALVKKLAEKETSAGARYVICDILGELRDPSAVQALLPVLSDKEEHVTSVASAAARALGLLGDAAAVPALRAALASEDIEVRYEAVRALGALRAVEAAPDLRKVVGEELKLTAYDRYVPCAAVEALGRMKDKAAARDIAGWLSNATPETGTGIRFSFYAIRALESITGAALGSLTKSEDDRMKTEAEWLKWWEEHKKEYGAEEPPKPPEEPKKEDPKPEEPK